MTNNARRVADYVRKSPLRRVNSHGAFLPMVYNDKRANGYRSIRVANISFVACKKLKDAIKVDLGIDVTITKSPPSGWWKEMTFPPRPRYRLRVKE